jgi:hypothetical protein
MDIFGSFVFERSRGAKKDSKVLCKRLLTRGSRRALIGHYALGDCTAISKFYHPVFNMNGEQVRFGVNEGGSECGEFVEIGGERSVAMRPGSAKDRLLLTE